MKPLTLTIHPRLENTNLNPDEIRQGRLTTLALMKTKRLTDAELAAQYWCSERDLTIHGYDAMASFYLTRECATLHRFATTPHYSEEAA